MRRMQLKLRLLVTITIVLVSVIHAQLDRDLCPTGSTPAIPDLYWSPVPSRFEIMTELVTDNEVAELSQALTPQRDVIVFTTTTSIQLYWDFGTNEHFTVLGVVIENEPTLQCLRQVINSESQTGTIMSGTLFVKPSVLLGYDSRNQVNQNWGVELIGQSTVRGIPTNTYKSCFYLPDIQATVAAIYQVSDATKFQAYLPGNQSVILEINVQIAENNGRKVNYTYNVFHYTPNPNRGEERQALETPSGVFCLNRTNTRPTPSNLPERLSVNNEVMVPQANLLIVSSHTRFDQSSQFTRFDVWGPNPTGSSMTHVSELHDFGTGLSYKYNHQTHQCKVDNMTLGMGDSEAVVGQPNLLQMAGGPHLFMMDDIDYQYTGEKRCRDRVFCHVWIGEKLMPNNTGVEHREWYWAFEINGNPLQEWIPVKYISNTLDPKGKTLTSIESNVFNFRRETSNNFQMDSMIADCYRAIGPEEKFNLGVISFTVANDQEYPVQKYIDYLRQMILQTLTLALGVRPIRISNIIVDHDGKDLPVTLTLLDAPPRLGPVEFPLHEILLTTAIARLRTIIDSNGLAFRAKFGTKEVMLRARSNSLQVIYTSFDQCLNQTFDQNQKSNEVLNTNFDKKKKLDQCNDTISDPNLDQNLEIIYKKSGPLITGFWVGFIILGFTLGIVGAFFVSKRFYKQ